MVDQKVFATELARLGIIYRVDMTSAFLDEYYRILRDRMTTEAFVAACDAIRSSPDDEFFPRPARFLELGRGNVEVEAVTEWTQALESASWKSNGRESINVFPFSPRGRFAWGSLGGAERVGSADPRELDFLRREFLARYQAVSEPEIEAVANRIGAPRHELAARPREITEAVARLVGGMGVDS